MSGTRITVNSTLKQRMLIQLSQRTAWSLSLALWALIVFSLAAFAFDTLRTGNFDPKWIVVWLVTYFEVALLAVIALKLLPKSLWQKTSSGLATNLVLSALLGAVKNPSVYFLAVNLGLEETPFDPFLRIAGGVMLTTSMFVICVLMYSSRSAHRELMKSIHERYRTLNSYRNQIPQATDHAKTELIKQTKETLLPKLQLLNTLLQDKDAVRTAIEDLQELIENSVRPLSRAFQKQAEQIAAEHDSLSHRKVGFGFPTRFKIRENMPLMTILGLVLPSTWFVLYMVGAANYWPWLVPAGALLLGTLAFCKLGMPRGRQFRKRDGITRIAAITALTPLPFTGLLIFAIPDEFTSKPLVVGSAFAIVVFSVLPVIYVNVLDEARTELEIESQTINEKIAFELAVFNQNLWLQKRRWGYLLHGKVQSNLTAALARLRSLEASENQNPTQRGMLIELVKQDLYRAAEALSSEATESVNLKSELANLQESWRGVVDLSIQVSDRANRALIKSDNARLSLIEICREAVSNGYRHGMATTMTIQVDRPDDATLQLTCTNNGNQPTSRSGGMGTQMMDALTVEWHLEYKKTAGLTVLSARLPISDL